MISLNFENLENPNVSLQVGDAVYARTTNLQPGSHYRQAGWLNSGTGVDYFVGILREIQTNGSITTGLGGIGCVLLVDDDPTSHPFSASNPWTGGYYQPQPDDFIMFSKYDQSVGEVSGYYAEAKFVNDSKEKAELFMISSEVIINSK